MTFNIAILGASGIGKYHAREFNNLGCKIVAILGSTEESAHKTAELLKKEFNISANTYSDIKDLLTKENIDAVSICTPPETHEKLVLECLNKNIHVLCEKPIIGGIEELVSRTKALLALAKKKEKILAVNTQMAALIPSPYPKIVSQFSAYTEPGTKGDEMLLDHGPHVNSMLIKLVPNGKAFNIKVEKKTEDEIILTFSYISKKQKCLVKYHLKHKADRPRAIRFNINEKEYSREVGENYEQFLISEGKKQKIEDPLKTSIRMFVESVQNYSSPLVSPVEVEENSLLQQALIENIFQSQI